MAVEKMTSSFVFAVYFFATILSASYVSCQKNQWNGLSVRMLVVGKTGVGKSTLINNIIGKNLTKVGEDLESETKKIELINDLVNGTGVKICDTPGFRDGQDKDEEYLEEIVKKCSNPDVVLFCIRMDETRWTDDDQATILGINTSLGESIWNNTVLVLTFADKVDFDKTIKFEKKWKDKFSRQLNSIGVNKEVVDSIPVVMSSSSVDPNLSGIGNWLPKLFLACLHASTKSGRDGLYAILIKHIHNEYLRDDEGYLKIYYCDIVNW